MARAASPDEAARVFAAIDRLVEMRAAEPKTLEEMTRAPIAPVPALSNAYFTVYQGRFPAGSPFAQIEVRRQNAAEPERGMILLDLAEAVCIDADAVLARFGGEPGLEPPRSRQPPGSPTYYIYEKPWGRLSLALSPGTRECLRSAVIDWHTQ